jgi:hypothetical protein
LKISGFCHDADEICALLGYNAGKGLPLDAALCPIRAQISSLLKIPNVVVSKPLVHMFFVEHNSCALQSNTIEAVHGCLKRSSES